MTVLVLQRSRLQVALSHLALYGLAAILEDAGTEVQLSWTHPADTRPQLDLPSLDERQIGATVRSHATAQLDTKSWIAHDITLKNSDRGLMSPRLTQFGNEQTWQRVQRARHEVLDDLTDNWHLLDLRMIGALGEPAYWSRNNKGDIFQDHGASHWDMQPRNQGSEIVRTRLRKLAAAVAARDPEAVVAGIQGTAVRDEIGKDEPDSSTATGLAPRGPTDNTLAWCALWGISQLPIAMRTAANHPTPPTTTGHIRRTKAEWFYLPVWHHQWRPARLRTILASAHLRTVAFDGLELPARDQPLATAMLAARSWLAARGVAGLVRFPIERFGSDKAPERRAMAAELVTIER